MFPAATSDDIMYSETQVRTMGSDQQSFCLKWNHHKTNLVEILDALIKVETYVDCTLVVDDQVSFKAHRVVLAANSPYFQSILSNVPMDHCSILFPGVKDFEMRALLEYMYTGEVNVIQAHIPNIMKVAEQLEVKGLFDMSEFRHRPNGEHISGESPPRVVPAVPSNNVSPQGPLPSARLLPPPNVPVLSAAYDSVDMNPLKRKKLSSMLASRDTPILRNVLAQNSPPDPQPVSLVCHSNNQQAPPRLHSNGSSHESERVPSPQRIFDYRQRRLSSRASSPHYNRSDRSEDAHSPYTDRSYEEDSARTFHPSSPPTNFQQDVRSGLATYVPAPQQKPEWKRYKQYTRSDIMSAIECVRNGMSALQASRKYGVPSRTLYDKVKKLGITTSRPMSRGIKRETNGAAFPYGLSGTGGNEDGPSTAPLLDPAFIQHALEGASRDGGREALHAMALAAAAHAALAPRTSPPSLPHSSPSPPHDEDHVEDLSVSRRRDPDPPSGVIVPPRSFALDCSSERD